MHYEIKPWSRIYPLAIRGQFLRDMALFESPDKVRWVFAGKRLRMQKRNVVKEVCRILTSKRFSQDRSPDYRRWLDVLDRIIVVA